MRNAFNARVKTTLMISMTEVEDFMSFISGLLFLIIWIGIPIIAIYSFIALIVECVRAKKEYRKIRPKVVVRFIVATMCVILLFLEFMAFVYIFSGR